MEEPVYGVGMRPSLRFAEAQDIAVRLLSKPTYRFDGAATGIAIVTCPQIATEILLGCKISAIWHFLPSWHVASSSLIEMTSALSTGKVPGSELLPPHSPPSEIFTDHSSPSSPSPPPPYSLSPTLTSLTILPASSLVPHSKSYLFVSFSR